MRRVGDRQDIVDDDNGGRQPERSPGADPGREQGDAANGGVLQVLDCGEQLGITHRL